MLLSQFLFVPGLIPLIRDKASYVPRTGSALTALGLVGVTVALLGFGSYLGASMTVVTASCWGFVFLFRGSRIGVEE